MEQVIKSLASVCPSVSQYVCRRSYGRNFFSIFMKFCTVVRGVKSKIEFVSGDNPTTSSPILPPIFYPRNVFSMGRFSYHSKEARESIVTVNSSTNVSQRLL